ncbi:hypothetical protein EWI11_08650 [Enterococcus faecium]|uniref:Uncharacterized protein n=1 Tax=Enterococcus faecium TaxID=1352 RepID=A0A1M2WR16_ENTFC|nr:hypothetical protein AL026_02745 [Enterococcus faecium]EEV41807.1 predicted protein [Enterococcus faecium 1,230,933]EEV53666.1 predicted protein [Enterococcus faecium 1,231,410]APV55906.1 hypothetical protein AL023_00865 [Enterococcus faecium]AQY30044.1 hypothetical protein B4W80_14575 [Enterococcus faecium]
MAGSFDTMLQESFIKKGSAQKLHFPFLCFSTNRNLDRHLEIAIPKNSVYWIRIFSYFFLFLPYGCLSQR